MPTRFARCRKREAEEAVKRAERKVKEMSEEAMNVLKKQYVEHDRKTREEMKRTLVQKDKEIADLEEKVRRRVYGISTSNADTSDRTLLSPTSPKFLMSQNNSSL